MTYTTLDGRVLNLSGLTADERAFLDRCVAAYRDEMAWDALSRLIEGIENPLVRAEGGRITRAVWDHPLFQAVSDLEDRLGIAQGDLDADPDTHPDRDPFAHESVEVAEAPAR